MSNLTLIRNGRYGVAALLLVGTSMAAMGQATPPATDAMVTADTATHTAALTGAGEGNAWFLVDPQNNTIRWHIEYTGIEPTGAAIVCPAEEGAAPGGEADMGTAETAMGAIMIVPPDGTAPAAGADDMAGGDMTGMVEVVNLLEEGGTIMSPLEGQTADLEETVFNHIASGACYVELTVAGAGEGAAAPAGATTTPATPAMPATPPAPGP